MPYSALFAQSKSYFTHKVRGCQTFLQRIDKLFYINISPAFPLSSVPHLCFRSDRVIAAEPDIAPRRAARRGFIHAPRPARTSFLQKDLSPPNTPDNFRGIAAVISSVLRLRFRIEPYSSPWIIGIRRAARDTSLLPAQARKARPSPAPEFLFSEPLYARARPPCASFGLTAPCKHPHREPSAYLPQSLLPPYRTPILSQTYKNRSSAIKLNGEKQ